ncbi:hypothetical protein CPAR01_05087 [Colletotrichum paranaense]|uniref:Uncharacterized protein n=2 Tax=Colletotrichum acutatum species complex TaxID=2707335 RepID=A0ABQ9PQI3_9PEZI|nr:uncharacterized protein CPAR01_05087 [Colletotrichum paranaense]KAK0373794.1 hypothetical protein CLIM01_08842 [Colletotrichum limetticola]KAK1541700.1 hypothetical protein CPAR01_05087 [Colletotrichum paranaense]
MCLPLPWSDRPPERSSITHEDGRSRGRSEQTGLCPSHVRFRPETRLIPIKTGVLPPDPGATAAAALSHTATGCESATLTLPPHVKICTWSQVPYHAYLRYRRILDTCCLTRQRRPPPACPAFSSSCVTVWISGLWATTTRLSVSSPRGWTTSIAHDQDKPREARTAPCGEIKGLEGVRSTVFCRRKGLVSDFCNAVCISSRAAEARVMSQKLLPLEDT